jgi:hypothetical protein
MRIRSQLFSREFGLLNDKKKSKTVDAKVIAKHKNGDLVLQFGKSETVTVSPENMPNLEVGERVDVPISKILDVMIPAQDSMILNSKSNNNHPFTQLQTLLTDITQNISTSKELATSVDLLQSFIAIIDESDIAPVLKEEITQVVKELLKELLPLLKKEILFENKGPLSKKAIPTDLKGIIKEALNISQTNDNNVISKDQFVKMFEKINSKFFASISQVTPQIPSKQSNEIETQLIRVAISSPHANRSDTNIIEKGFSGVKELSIPERDSILNLFSNNEKGVEKFVQTLKNRVVRDPIALLVNLSSAAKNSIELEKQIDVPTPQTESLQKMENSQRVSSLLNTDGTTLEKESFLLKPEVIIMPKSEVAVELKHLLHKDYPNLSLKLSEAEISNIVGKTDRLPTQLLNIVEDILALTPKNIVVKPQNLESILTSSISKLPLSILNSETLAPLIKSTILSNDTDINGVLSKRLIELQSQSATLKNENTEPQLQSTQTMVNSSLFKGEKTEAELVKPEPVEKLNVLGNENIVSKVVNIEKSLKEVVQLFNSTISMDESSEKVFSFEKIVSKLGLFLENSLLTSLPERSEINQSVKGQLFQLLKQGDELLSLLKNNGVEELEKSVQNIKNEITSLVENFEGKQVLSEKKSWGNRSEQNLQLPVIINGELTTVNFRVERDLKSKKSKKGNSKDQSKVTISLKLKGSGVVESQLELTTNKQLRVKVEGNQSKTVSWFLDHQEDIVKSLEREGISSVIFKAGKLLNLGSKDSYRFSKNDSFEIVG